MKTRYPTIALQGAGELMLIRESEIIYAVAAGNYTEIYLEGNRKIRTLRKLKEVGHLLPGECFFRIHRSHLINLEYAIQYDQMKAKVLLSDGTYLPIAQNRKSEFINRFTKI